ncbi:MAG: isocitrate/isopropylmalate dehydrogenase family protein [Candidatus Bathyarchaeota archaeon]|nr:MAG: isocitrate/isopropylmalate dehydrogenase family protein [Candidatus Bathyarchaeota archaeon]
MYKIVLMPGDGIGPELTATTLEVLHAIQDQHNLSFRFINVDAGDACYARRGIALPSETVQAIETSDACLKGPVGETAADVIVRLRLLFDLYANLRPLKSYPNAPSMRPDIDMLFVRENTEGVYRGLELNIDEDTAVCLRVITRKGSERIARYAFKMALERGKDLKVTAIHKSNVMRVTDGLFSKVCNEVAQDYPEISLQELYVDAAAMELIRSPHAFDVIVTTNMFGDILSDEAAMTVGGLGMAPGANIGDRYALFEPIHGSAPSLAGKQVANPTSMILAAKLMLEWLGSRHSDSALLKAAESLEDALTRTLLDKILTQDLGGTARTNEFGKAVAKNIR